MRCGGNAAGAIRAGGGVLLQGLARALVQLAAGFFERSGKLVELAWWMPARDWSSKQRHGYPGGDQQRRQRGHREDEDQPVAQAVHGFRPQIGETKGGGFQRPVVLLRTRRTAEELDQRSDADAGIACGVMAGSFCSAAANLQVRPQFVGRRASCGRDRQILSRHQASAALAERLRCRTCENRAAGPRKISPPRHRS